MHETFFEVSSAALLMLPLETRVALLKLNLQSIKHSKQNHCKHFKKTVVCSSICGQIVNKINIYQLPKKKASDEKCITKLATLAIFCCYVYLVCKAVWPDFFLFFFVYGGCCCLREISGIAVGLCKSFTVESDRVGLGNFQV